MVARFLQNDGHRLRILFLAAAGVMATLLVGSCDKMPLLAPTGTVITLFPSSSTVPTNGQIEIIATVIEQGVATAPTTTTTATTPGNGNGGTPPPGTGTTTAGAGTPVHNGTLVSFTTTIGRIEPREARTQNGEVRVRFFADGQNGTAVITAYSGGAVGTLNNLAVGTAAAGRIAVSANPQNLGASGGTTTVTARVETEAGTPLPGITVTFTTTSGSFSSNTAVTDANGIATTTLTTTGSAVVTARAGAREGETTVGLNARLIASVTATPASTTTGMPVTFEITSGPGANVAEATIDYGDGQRESLGSFGGTGGTSPTPGTVRTQHIYNQPGIYQVVVTGRDAVGNPGTASTSVAIGRANINLTASPAEPTANAAVTFTATVPTGALVDEYEWYVDGALLRTTSGNSTTHAFSGRGNHTVRVVVIGVGGGEIGSATLVLNVR